jgi:hypothetical protein
MAAKKMRKRTPAGSNPKSVGHRFSTHCRTASPSDDNLRRRLAELERAEQIRAEI